MAETLVESFADFARRLGVARSTVTRAAQAGRLVLAALPEGGRGVVVEASLQRWHDSRGLRDDVAARHAEARGQAVPSAQPAAAPVAPATGGATPRATGRAQHQAAALHWQNELLRLQLQIQRGEQLSADAVLAELQGLGASLRGLAERLVDQLAPRLAVAVTRADRQRLLQQELRAARKQLRREFPQALRRLVQQARKAGVEPNP